MQPDGQGVLSAGRRVGSKFLSVAATPPALEILPESKLGQALGYLRNNWDALKRFLSDAHLPIDNNEAEPALRRIAAGRKNWLFVATDPRKALARHRLRPKVGRRMAKELVFSKDVWLVSIS